MIRVYVGKYAFSDAPLVELVDVIRKCANQNAKADDTVQRVFWKRQLSKEFFLGSHPPCPILTTLMMHRYDQDFCFECHASKKFEDWLQGHARSMKIMPTMLTGKHTSNCIHNAFTIARDDMRSLCDLLNDEY